MFFYVILKYNTRLCSFRGGYLFYSVTVTVIVKDSEPCHAVMTHTPGAFAVMVQFAEPPRETTPLFDTDHVHESEGFRVNDSPTFSVICEGLLTVNAGSSYTGVGVGCGV